MARNTRSTKAKNDEQQAIEAYEAACRKAHETITEQGFIVVKQLRAVVIIHTLLIIYLIISTVK